MLATALAAVAAGIVAAPGGALVTGPWRVVTEGAKTGGGVAVSVQGRWTYSDEFGGSSGIVETYPIPRRMAVLVTATPRQRFTVTWSILCYGNREFPAKKNAGVAHPTGRFTLYPVLYAKRVECDPFVQAHMPGSGTLRIRVLAY